MRNLFAVLIALICLAGMPPTAHAAKPAKAIKESKEYLVLMPLRVAEEDQNLQGQMQSALVEGLQQKYKVFWGEEVENKARQIFHKENLKHECNEERCLQGIAEAFQSELLATAIITKQDGGYFLSLKRSASTLSLGGCAALRQAQGRLLFPRCGVSTVGCLTDKYVPFVTRRVTHCIPTRRVGTR